VTVLRRRATEQDEEARQVFVPRRPVHRDGVLTAAQIGSAHHLFMQRVRLDRTGSALELHNEAESLVAEGFLSHVEAAALDYDAILGFWASDSGRRVVAHQEISHRELPFTARLTMSDLCALGLSNAGVDANEFVVVQGIVDLALISHDWIEILDFKTDRLRNDAREKAVTYVPQIRLYAAALGAIYRRPVRAAALHFLATGETLPISVSGNLSAFVPQGV
jgi:ATP-dependent helicase/nuclease subunit A